jgi:hypothetical protein
MSSIGDGISTDAIEQNPDIARIQAAQQGAALQSQQVRLPATGFVSELNGQEGSLTLQPGTSSTGVTVNVTNGAGTISVGVTGIGAGGTVKCNFAAIIAPTVGDDSSLGYAVGSSWIDTVLDDAYICCDATNGAAVWKKTTP